MFRSLWQSLANYWSRFLPAAAPPPQLLPLPRSTPLRSLERVVLTDQVEKNLFDDFRRHRQSDRGGEEIGWVLLGVREEREALVLATLPAGTFREAGWAHVRFNSQAQAVATRGLRQHDKRLGIVGVVHTHPGSLRHPSEGDYRGDIQWVARLRGQAGIFGIGTADPRLGEQLAVHQHGDGDALFSWFTLASGDLNYRRLPVERILGSDAAAAFHPLWPTLERHASALERLVCQQAGAKIEPLEEDGRPILSLSLPLVEERTILRVLLQEGEVRYYIVEGQALYALTPEDKAVDKAVYRILGEWAGRSSQ